jgi:hypothetical protein
VWVQGDLAEVWSTTESVYGYTAFHVKYIERPPSSEVPDDYLAGFEVKLITKKALIDHSAEELGKSIQTEKGVTPSREQLREYATKAVIDLFHLQQHQMQARQRARVMAADKAFSPTV